MNIIKKNKKITVNIKFITLKFSEEYLIVIIKRSPEYKKNI